MTLKKVLTSIRHAIFGKPVSYEEMRAAQRTTPRDPAIDAKYEIRSARFSGMSF